MFVFDQLKATFFLPIIGVKKNPQSPLYSQLGVITKGTVIEVGGCVCVCVCVTSLCLVHCCFRSTSVN